MDDISDESPNVHPLTDLPIVRVGPSDGATSNGSLIGSACSRCGATYFPARARCAECRSPNVSHGPLPKRGLLYAFTTVHVASSEPTPYTLGYVDLDNGVRVLAHLEPAAELAIGMPVRLATSCDGSWRFVPERSEAGSP